MKHFFRDAQHDAFIRTVIPGKKRAMGLIDAEEQDITGFYGKDTVFNLVTAAPFQQKIKFIKIMAVQRRAEILVIQIMKNLIVAVHRYVVITLPLLFFFQV